MIGAGGVGVLPDGLLRKFDPIAISPVDETRNRPANIVEACLKVAWTEAFRDIQFNHRLATSSQEAQSQSKMGMGEGEVRIECDGILELRDGIPELQTLAMYVPQGDVRPRIVYIQPDGLLRGIPGWRQNGFRWLPAP